MDRYIRCLDCAQFLRSATSPEAGLGRCPSARLAWNGHPGQWPRKQHPCAAFVPMENPRGEDSPRDRRPEGRPEARKTTPGAESAAPGHLQPPTAGAPRAIGGAPALSATSSAETGGDVPTGSVSRPGQGGSDIGALPPNAPRTDQNPNPPARRNGAAGGLFPEGA